MKFDLVFEGGGAKGIVFTGALQEFWRRGHTFDRLMGTSAGAIMATFLAAGYTLDEMRGALLEKTPDGRPMFTTFLGVPRPFPREVIEVSLLRNWLREADIPLLPEGVERYVDDWFMDQLLRSPLHRHVFSFVERGGWFSADPFVSYLNRKLDEGRYQGKPRNFSGMNMKAFFDVTGVDLTLLAADTTRGRLLVLNHRTAPELPLVYAVRMSMSVPLLWQEVVWEAEWGGYRGKDISDVAVVDGGLLSNFPIELFITGNPVWLDVMGPKVSGQMIGMLIDEYLEVPGAPPKAKGAGPFGNLGQFKPVQRILDMVDTVTQARDKAVIERYEQFVVRLPAKGYGTTEFGMSDARRDALVQAGQATMAAYLDLIDASPPSTFPVAEAFTDFTAPADEVAARILGD